MTLVAGFRCQDGLILCADTQETITGYAKIDTDKLSGMIAVAGCVYVGGTGDSDLIDMAVDALTDHFVMDRCPVDDWRGVEKEIKKVLTPLFQDQTQRNSFLAPEERPYAELLIACRAKDGKTMLKVSGTKVRRVQKAQCIGTGMLIANGLVKELFDQNMTMKQAGLLAIYVMYRAKRYVDQVGGNTDILFVGDWGLTRIPTKDVQRIESWWLEVEQAGISCTRWLTLQKPTEFDAYLLGGHIDIESFAGVLGKLKEAIAFYDAIYAEVDAVLNPNQKPESGMVTKILRIGGRSFTQAESV